MDLLHIAHMAQEYHIMSKVLYLPYFYFLPRIDDFINFSSICIDHTSLEMKTNADTT